MTGDFNDDDEQGGETRRVDAAHRKQNLRTYCTVAVRKGEDGIAATQYLPTFLPLGMAHIIGAHTSGLFDHQLPSKGPAFVSRFKFPREWPSPLPVQH